MKKFPSATLVLDERKPDCHLHIDLLYLWIKHKQQLENSPVQLHPYVVNNKNT